MLLFAAGILSNLLGEVKWQRFTYGILGTIAALLATLIFLKLEKKIFADYELSWKKNSILKFFNGLLIGAVIYGGIILVLLSFSQLQMEKNTTSINLGTALVYLTFIPLALMEEIAFRAYPFLKLNRAFGLRITQIIVAITFAVYHIIMGWNVQVAFLGPGIWAFVFGLAAIWSKGIALPTGIHVALNVGQQLISMKGESQEALWIIKNKTSATQASIANADTIGLVTQLLILVATITLTEFYIRKKTFLSSSF